ncbi:MAG: hypothetical protein A3I88_03355 [Candidatus Portnoybacteria bacterium RIFCSPLOWO2_12_FULL_39_9]|uniref:Addiction module toxin, HicA family n=1 Tax=Candidatus Portnoybacteria bacterium RIFCSPHIGHO2_12_FULL_38_9 TaxID=1801997 RepID=A0A1G2FIE6_9BACT|nr:MAG: hypothetical protein A3H00_02795 [Candidatus Portnoybacteria bacterium RBG_13_40_8]OGZ36134.1 MAG: hypothetical protein A2646_02440 [Candidatus Portnoybacteria bacterium RIFCSPHIGHO2_02_FULL_39_12]OGZ37291.1 MAG: hypothetical protein A3J64_01520 [Candidatus Portnoybacteria bacterium RIFCSPHIGHO2_12_FULL_38_9]OGZ40644.1 MAG: hypothetical protein A3I88_03355 [Candidatus Portnoybacteria bacterium RIFCSPLOWO2_12_FULL_39_9]
MKLPVLKPRTLIKVLNKLEFYEVRKTGSHVILANKTSKQIISVPVHENKDIKKGLLRSIIRQTGLTVKEFIEML